LGQTGDGTPFTLLNGRGWFDAVFRDKKYQTLRIRADRLLLGDHVDGDSSPVIKRLVCTFTHLEKWFDPLLTSTEADARKTVVMLNAPEFELRLQWMNVEFAVVPWYEVTGHSAIPSTGSFTHNQGLEIRSSAPASLAWYVSVTGMLRRLLTFLTGCGVFTTELRPCFARVPPGEDREGYLLQPVAIPSLLQTERHAFSTLYSSIAASLPAVAAAWFREADRLDVAVRAHAELLNATTSSPEAAFLRIVQVLEHLHGLLFPDRTKYLPRAAWASVVNRLLPNIEQSFAEVSSLTASEAKDQSNRVAGQIGFLNQATLRSKLEDLLSVVPPPTTGTLLDWRLLGRSQAPDDPRAGFAKRVSDTRHFLTHYDDEQRKRSLAGSELNSAVLSCWGLLTYWLARELGLDEETCAHMVHQAKRAVFRTGFDGEL
jgi:hypothetical protein